MILLSSIRLLYHEQGKVYSITFSITQIHVFKVTFNSILMYFLNKALIMFSYQMPAITFFGEKNLFCAPL